MSSVDGPKRSLEEANSGEQGDKEDLATNAKRKKQGNGDFQLTSLQWKLW